MTLTRSLHSRENRAAVAVLVASRLELKLKQEVIAARLKTPRSIVSKIESGERKLGFAEFLKWARALKVDPITLLIRILSWEGNPEYMPVARPPRRRRARAKASK